MINFGNCANSAKKGVRGGSVSGVGAEEGVARAEERVGAPVSPRGVAAVRAPFFYRMEWLQAVTRSC